LGLRDPLGPKTKQLNLRVPPEVRSYLERAKEATGRSKTAVFLDAVRLERSLDERLDVRKAELKAFAHENGLDFATEFPRVIALAVERFLDARARRLKK
jgi:hypothetical protein